MNNDMANKPLNPLFKAKLILLTTMMILAALSFNAFLTSATLEKIYIKTVVSTYQIIGRDLQISLEKAIRYGKKIDKFVGIEYLLQDTYKKMNTNRESNRSYSSNTNAVAHIKNYVAIALMDSTIKYCSDPELIGTKSILPPGESDGPQEIKKILQKEQKRYVIPLPIKGPDKKTVAFVVIGFDSDHIKELLNSIHKGSLKTGGLILLCGLMLLTITTNIIPLTKGDNALEVSRKRIMAASLAIIILSQIAFSVYSNKAFYSYYLQINREKAVILNHLLKEKIEFLLKKGLTIDRLFKVENMMHGMIDPSPEIQKMELLNKNNQLLYRADTAQEKNAIRTDVTPKESTNGRHADNPYHVKTRIMKQNEIQGHLMTTISKTEVRSRIKSISLDSLTVLIISILFSFELLIIIFQMLNKTIQNTQIHYGDIRPAAFIFSFGIDICVSFLPLYIDQLHNPITWIPKDIFTALPISVEMLFEGVGIFMAGAWLDKRGWHEPFFCGIALTGIGLLHSWLAPDAVHLIVSRGTAGLGYGFVILSAQGFAISYSNADQKSHSLTQLYAGLYAGSICGGAAGAMIAEKLGFRSVFLVGALLLFSILIYVFIFMRNAIKKSRQDRMKAPTESISPLDLFRYCTNRNILGLITLIIIPASISLIGFLYYCCPIYLNQHNVSQSNIGRVFMLHGICLVYIAPFISKFVDRSPNKRLFLMLSGLAAGIAFMAYYFFQSFFVTLFSAVMLGVAGSLMYAAQTPYILSMEMTQKIGEGRALSILSMASRIGQVAGPFIFGWMFIVGIDKGLPILGVIYVIAAIGFIMITQKEKA